MSISEEKMLILKMVQDGKITSEEASRLLEALDKGTRQTAPDNTFRQQRQPNFQDEVSKMREKVKDWSKDFKNNYNQNDFDRSVEEFSVKAEKIGKNVAATTFGIVDRVIDFVGSFVDTNSFNIFGSYAAVDKSFEAFAVEGMELDIEGTNGNIIVKKHLENKIIIKSKVRSPINNSESILVFNDSGDKVSLKLNKIGNISVSHEVYLPLLKFKSIKLETTNGKIYVEDSLAESFEGITRNGNIDLMGVNSEKIAVDTKNGKIELSYVIGRDIDINTNNSVIDIKHIKAEKLKAVTMNGRILVENAQNYEACPVMSMDLKTSNGGIKINMDDVENRGYKVKAKTTNSGVNLLIPEMVYGSVSRSGAAGSNVEAQSSDYESKVQKVNIEAESVNGYIEIVK